MRLTADEIYNRLKNTDNIESQSGRIMFSLDNVDIVVKRKDVVGNILQEWIQGWFDANGIEYAISDNTQMPPDFYLNPGDRTVDLLEIKSFNLKAGSPGFDIADFRAYSEEIIAKPYMLYADYLIFGYTLDETAGILSIEKMWLKKVWQITRCMTGWALNLQIKKNIVYKIRPGKWYAKRTKMPAFKRVEDFVSAIEDVMYQYSDTRRDASKWRQMFLKGYSKFYHKTLKIPQWQNIESNYRLP